MKQAMITIEVLISLLILFMVIAISTVTIKQLKIVREQQLSHEEIYMLVLNIEDYISDDICVKKETIEGDFESYIFHAQCKKEQERREYTKAFDEGDVEGNNGNRLVQLYKITLRLTKNRLEKSYIYYKTVVKKIQ